MDHKYIDLGLVFTLLRVLKYNFSQCSVGVNVVSAFICPFWCHEDAYTAVTRVPERDSLVYPRVSHVIYTIKVTMSAWRGYEAPLHWALWTFLIIIEVSGVTGS